MPIVIPTAGTKMWLISGISNARGMGTLDYFPVGYNKYSKRIYSLDQYNRWVQAKDPLIGKGSQYGALNNPTFGGVGLGISFANKLIEHRPANKIGLVVSAKGGRTQDYFAPSESTSSAYYAIKKRAEIAKAIGPIEGMIWYSGEADTMTDEYANAWEQGFTDVIDQLRIDLATDFPVLVVAIGDFKGKFALEPRRSRWLTLRNTQMNIDHHKVHPVTANGLPLKDTAHLSSKGQMQLGRNLANTYAALYL